MKIGKMLIIISALIYIVESVKIATKSKSVNDENNKDFLRKINMMNSNLNSYSINFN